MDMEGIFESESWNFRLPGTGHGQPPMPGQILGLDRFVIIIVLYLFPWRWGNNPLFMLAAGLALRHPRSLAPRMATAALHTNSGLVVIVVNYHTDIYRQFPYLPAYIGGYGHYLRNILIATCLVYSLIFIADSFI
jgi:hypothetical protein